MILSSKSLQARKPESEPSFSIINCCPTDSRDSENTIIENGFVFNELRTAWPGVVIITTSL